MPRPTTMRAWRVHEYGEPEDVLQMDEVPVPEPGPGELLVRVQAIPLNLNDMERITGKNMPLFGSQGQQKTYLVALKLAEFEFIRKITDLSPILLLDDIFDKFDSKRVKHIISLVAQNNFGQIFITDTNASRLHGILNEISTEHQIFGIDHDGGIKLMED